MQRGAWDPWADLPWHVMVYNPPMSDLRPTLTLVGDAAVLVEFRDGEVFAANGAARALGQALVAAAPPWLRDVTPAYRTLLVAFDSLVGAPDAVAADIEALSARLDVVHAAPARLVTIPVRYGGDEGPDLSDVAQHTGLSEAEVIARHTAAVYTVMFIGFMPGFPYLSGLDPALATPRLASPRRAVAAGSVGIGGDQTGVYPSLSPGGWRLIGRTALALYDPRHDPPTLLRAGDEVRFAVAGR